MLYSISKLTYITRMNTIEWSKKAHKQLSKINTGNRSAAMQVYQAIDKLKSFPECLNVKRLTNHKYDYRLRTGDFRVFFEHDGILKIVSIEEIKRKNENTY